MIRKKLNTEANDTALQSLPPSSSSSPPTTTIRVVNGGGLVPSLTGTNNDGPQSVSLTPPAFPPTSTLPLSESSQPSSAIARRDNDTIPLHVRKEHSFPKMQPSLRSFRRDLHPESVPRPHPTSSWDNPTPRIGQAAPLPLGDSLYRSPAMFSSPATMLHSPPVPQRQTTTSTNASPPPAPHNPMTRPTVPRSRSHNTFANSSVARPSTGGGTSSARTSGAWMRPQSAPSRYPNGVGSPYYPPPLLPNSYQPSRPTNRPSSNFSQTPVFPPPSLNGSNSHISRPPSRKPTIEAFVANDPFRPHGQKAPSRTVDDNVTFDDIPTPPSPPEEIFPNGQNGPYMMPQSNYSFVMAKPAVPFSTYPSRPVMALSEGAPAYPSSYLASGLSGTASHSTGPTNTIRPEKLPLGQSHTSEYDLDYAYDPVEDIGLNGRRPSTYPGEPAIAEERPPQGITDSTGISPDGQPLNNEGPPIADHESQQWNPDIPLVPIRRPPESSWYDPYNYDPLANADDEHPFPFPHTYDQHPLPMTDNVKGFWSAMVNAFLWPFARKNSLLPQSVPTPPGLDAAEKRRLKIVIHFTFKTVPRQLYLYLLLLRLPSLYFSRVARIFEEADLTLPEIKKMALATASQASARSIDAFAFDTGTVAVAPQYQKLRTTWESFIDSVMREWKTFNIISVLLLSAILTILQIPGAAEDPITRFSALLSLICALISLLFGCMYIIRFGSMRKTYKAAEWALEAKKTKTFIWWNVWILLAMPAIWLTWSIVLYIVCIMSFIWRTTAQGGQLPSDLSHRGLLSLRLFITFVLVLGVLYGGLVLRTFRRYGEAMDRAWKTRIDGWIEERKLARVHSFYHRPFYNPQMMPADSSNGGYSSNQPYHPPPMPRYPSQSTSQTPPPIPRYPSQSTSQTPPPYNNDPRSPVDSVTTAESTSSTLYATQSNTLHNKKSTFREVEDVGFPIYKGPGYISNHSLPQGPANWSTTSVHSEQSHVSHKVGIVVPPPPPPLRSRPATPIAPISTSKPPNINVYIPTGDREGNYLGLTLEGRPETPENRVRFRSPLISAKDSSFGSDTGLSAGISTSDNTSLSGDVQSSPSTGNSRYFDANSVVENADHDHSPSPSRDAFPSDHKANYTGVIGYNNISSSQISHHPPNEIKASQVENTPMLPSTSSNDLSQRH